MDLLTPHIADHRPEAHLDPVKMVYISVRSELMAALREDNLRAFRDSATGKFSKPVFDENYATLTQLSSNMCSREHDDISEWKDYITCLTDWNIWNRYFNIGLFPGSAVAKPRASASAITKVSCSNGQHIPNLKHGVEYSQEEKLQHDGLEYTFDGVKEADPADTNILFKIGAASSLEAKKGKRKPRSRKPNRRAKIAKRSHAFIEAKEYLRKHPEHRGYYFRIFNENQPNYGSHIPTSGGALCLRNEVEDFS